jgi:hypothetical protein
LAGLSVGYNLIEAVVAVTAGVVAGSIALIGFGLDSLVEMSSGLVILWQFRHTVPESRERLALRLIALSFSPWPAMSASNRSATWSAAGSRRHRR